MRAALSTVLGLALIVGPSFESITRTREVGGWRRLVAGVAVAASVLTYAMNTETINDVRGKGNFQPHNMEFAPSS